MPHCCWPSLAQWLFYMTAFICHAANVLPSTWVWSRLYCICAGPGMATETTQVAILKIGSFDQHYDIIFGDKREETYDPDCFIWSEAHTKHLDGDGLLIFLCHLDCACVHVMVAVEGFVDDVCNNKSFVFCVFYFYLICWYRKKDHISL